MLLTHKEQSLTCQQLVFKWLMEKKISFLEVSQAYTVYLENVNKKKNVTINGLAIPLVYFWCKSTGKTKQRNIFFRAKAAWSLLKSGVFKTAAIEKDFEKCIQKIEYSEDENGHPKYNRKKIEGKGKL